MSVSRLATFAASLATGLLGLLATACSPIGAFNALAPHDSARLAGGDLAYGDHPRQRLDIYAPKAPAPGDAMRPVVIFFYGGAWNSGEKDAYAFAGKALAAQGFVVVVPDYRLVPEIRYPAFLEDNAAAVAWTVANIAEYGGDPDRLALAGHSAGAYNAAMLALDPAWLRRVGVDATRIRAFAGLAGPYDFLPFDDDVTIAAFGRADDPEATQPVNHVGADAPPAFLATGEDDERVFPRNTRALAAALRNAGGPVTETYYPDTGHAGLLLALSKPLRDRAPVLDELVAFLRPALQPAE